MDTLTSNPHIQTWLAGTNESTILGEGWYDRGSDWHGLPFRESYPSCSLVFPLIHKPAQLTLVLGSPRATFSHHQVVHLSWNKHHQEVILHGLPLTWQFIHLNLMDIDQSAGKMILVIQTDPWRHSDYENLPDHRLVGLLFGAALLIPHQL